MIFTQVKELLKAFIVKLYMVKRAPITYSDPFCRLPHAFSSADTFSYNLAQYLSDLLAPDTFNLSSIK